MHAKPRPKSRQGKLRFFLFLVPSLLIFLERLYIFYEYRILYAQDFWITELSLDGRDNFCLYSQVWRLFAPPPPTFNQCPSHVNRMQIAICVD
uniref:Secreted protein n=1 Tax=Steinernema glaseri TaxID=37863 RepID=A0A1I7Y680_9BILA